MKQASDNVDEIAPLSLDTASVARYARIRELLPAKAAAQLPRFLHESGNREQALLQLEILLQQHAASAESAFESNLIALRACVLLFGSSQWLGQTLLQNTDLIELLATPSKLVSARWTESYREELTKYCRDYDASSLAMQLARFKRREYVRIFARELLGLASLAEITAEISSLSDVLIERALASCEAAIRAQYKGWPKVRTSDGRTGAARFSVLSLGKLGGNELNYSSDIDLLFLFDDGEQARVDSIRAREFFTQVAQQLTTLLCKPSAEGQVFRVDLRLRPQGSSGDLIVGLAQGLRYYGETAHDWELQSLLKLRHSAGDRNLAQEFISRTQEVIYRKELSLSAIQTAARSLERIRLGTVRHRGREIDVKNDAGGIREIEFSVQCLQRVYGGVEKWLRSSGTLFALQKLHDKGHIGTAEFRELFNTYCVLRAIEHRVQCLHGVQSHRMSAGEGEQAAVLRSLAVDNLHVAGDVLKLMRSASALCARVLKLGSPEVSTPVSTESVNIGTPGSLRLSRELAGRSAALGSALAQEIGTPSLRNLQRFIAAASTGPKPIRTAIENVEWIERALPVLEKSALATDILARHPEDVVWLFRDSDHDEGESVSAQLRIKARRCMLRAIGRTIVEKAPVWQILREYTERFDALLKHALSAVEPPEEFAIFVVGRFATRELDVISDADLVFIRSATSNPDAAERCARSLVDMLSSYTREGTVITADTRLRPHGKEGELVVSSRQLAQYFENEAKSWETLAFGKLRFIAGSQSLAGNVEAAIQNLQQRFAARPEFVSELRAMRKRLADSGGPDSFKTGPGGLYDLDFVVGLLEARAALSPAGKQLSQRLERLVQGHWLEADEAQELMQAVDVFRRVDHAIRTVEGRSRNRLPQSDTLRESVAEIAGCADLNAVLASEMREVRTIFRRFFGD